MIDPRSLNRLLNLYVYGSSGTYLLHSLLDNHPHVLTMPIPQFNYFYDFFDANPDLNGEDLTMKMVNDWGVLFDANHKRHPGEEETVGEMHGLNRMGPNKNQELRVDSGAFVETLRQLIRFDTRPTRKRYFQAVHVAYAQAQGRELATDEPWIVYQLHWPSKERTRKVLADFPEAHFVHMIRQPAKSLASFFNGLYLGRGFASNGYAARCIDVILRGAPPVIEETRKRTFAICLESLHSEGEATMRRLVAWLEIPWNASLAESTFNGLKWWSVPSRKGELSGFDAKRLEDDNREVMSMLDEIKIKALLYDSYCTWGYATHSRFRSLVYWVLVFPFLILPFRMEYVSYRHAQKNEGFATFLKHLLRIRILSYQAWFRRGAMFIIGIKRRFSRLYNSATLDCQDPSALI